MEFTINKWIQERKRPAAQIFGDPVIMRAGKEIHVRDWIDSGREDTELYPTLEKYGSIERMIVDKEQVFGDLTAIKGLRDIIEQQKAAEDMWAGLPLEFRKEFLNDKTEFMRNGLDYLKKKIDAEKKKAELEKEPVIETPVIKQEQEVA